MSKYSKEQRKVFVAAWEADSLTKAEFCRQNKLNTKHFYHWCNRYESGKQPYLGPADQPLFARLTEKLPVAKTLSAEQLSLEITLPSGVKLKVIGAVNMQSVSQLAGELS